MSAVRTKYDADVAKFREIADQIAENTESYAAIYNEVAADNNAQSLEVKEPTKVRSGRKSAKLSRKKPKKTAGTPKGSLKAKKKKNVKKLQDECLTNVRKRDECIEEIKSAEKQTGEMELDLG
jgi:predicted patatin/cPLA2 family phospholipase